MEFKMNTITQYNDTNFFQRVWNGDLSLAKTFWIFGVTIQLILFGIMGQVIDFHQNAITTQNLKLSAYGIAFGYAFIVLYQIWISKGIWSSSSPMKYNGLVLWRLISRFVVILIMLDAVNCANVVFFTASSLGS